MNEQGGRVGRWLNDALGGFLVMANEFERPDAIAALAAEGIELPFDPLTGWLNASVQPGLNSWFSVVGSAVVAGVELKPELARVRVPKGELELTVFAAELVVPIERLLHRVGQRPARVRIDNHPDDPRYLFGVDLLSEITRSYPRHRRLRTQARKLLPAPVAEQLEMAWCPPSTLEVPPGLLTPRDEQQPDRAVGDSESLCRLCFGIAESMESIRRPYCSGCYADAQRGLFSDRGFDESWHESVCWALGTLAEIEFGGPPAVEQLAVPPTDGPNSDVLMLCRMLTARWSSAGLGSERKGYSWTDWLAKAGLLTEGIRRSRGVTVMAKDGHICRSLLERQIDDFFYEHGIAHETEPHYPFDREHNVGGYRADWELADGTFVEALGFLNSGEYMAKVARKLNLAALHQIPVITVTSDDLRQLASIFDKWTLPEDARPRGTELPPRPEPTIARASSISAEAHTRSAGNAMARAKRLERCRHSVELQQQGATRKEIANQLGASAQVVKSLLRDGKFYAAPQSDPDRLRLATVAAAGRKRGLKCTELGAEMKLSVAKTDECWRDAGVLFGKNNN
jgi:hypothetical protein